MFNNKTKVPPEPLPSACGRGVLTIAVGLLLITSCSSDSPPAIPQVTLAGMEPQVVAKITQLRDDVKSNPTDADSWGKLAMNLYAHELLPAAAVCFEQASKLESKEFRWPYFCAVTLDNLGNDKSLVWYRKALALQPADPQLNVRIGNAYLTQGSYEEAWAAFSKAIALDERKADAYVGLAQIEYNRKRYAEAAALLEKAINIEPDLRQAHALLISCYRMQWQQDKVMASSKRLLELKGRGPFTYSDPILDEIAREGVSFQWYMERGEQYLAQSQPAAAAAEFRRALRIRPEAPAYSQLGVALVRLGKSDEAISNFRKAHKLSPKSALLCFNLGFALCDNNLAGEGVAFLEQAVQLAPDEERYSAVLIDQYIRMGRWSDAVQFASSVYTSAPQNMKMGLKLAWMLATCPDDKLRNGAEAVKIAESVVQAMTNPHPEALDCLAAAYAENRQFALAVRTIAQAIQGAESAGQRSMISQFREREKNYLAEIPWRSEVGFRR